MKHIIVVLVIAALALACGPEDPGAWTESRDAATGVEVGSISDEVATIAVYCSSSSEKPIFGAFWRTYLGEDWSARVTPKVNGAQIATRETSSFFYERYAPTDWDLFYAEGKPREAITAFGPGLARAFIKRLIEITSDDSSAELELELPKPGVSATFPLKGIKAAVETLPCW